jgi:two-component system, chemotaxis family, CheB/CheR fusion protein
MKPFPVVGVGASAGGLNAFTRFLERLPLDTGMAFVLVQHLDPTHESALITLLSRSTSLPVCEITNKLRVEPNHIYVIPPNVSLIITKGLLRLQPRDRTSHGQRTIDSFFTSLAEDQQEWAIGVILSGVASDGTAGLEAIKAEGGITFAQDDSAEYDSMPRSAIAAGCVDFVLSPEGIARELARIAKHPHVKRAGTLLSSSSAGATASAPAPSARGGRHRVIAENGFQRILLLLRTHSKIDFSLYKRGTIERRIIRRMVLNKRDTLEAYAHSLRGDAKELDALCSDLLICVTSFFRDPAVFEELKRKVFPKLLSPRPRDPVRVWVPGCSTGQEAYSIAMVLTEVWGQAASAPNFQVFATDLNEALLDKARRGLYAKNLIQEVSPGRLHRFFVEEPGGYRVSKILRERVLFARQNLLSDPPFSRLDLISCRNLLIYIDSDLQSRILPTFHYALKPGGFLLLGASESIGPFIDLFAPVSKKLRIFARKPGAMSAWRMPHSKTLPAKKPVVQPSGRGRPPAEAPIGLNAQREADRLLLNRFAPPGVLLNAELQVLQFRGLTGVYLEPPAGKASFDVLKMAREGLMLPLRDALNRTKKANQAVRKENVRVKTNAGAVWLNLEVLPLKNLTEPCYLVLFEEVQPKGVRDATRKGRERVDKAGAAEETLPTRGLARRHRELEEELAGTRDYLQSVKGQYEAVTEEVQASNEEITSSNEELQSINEELETSKEELESSNEELTTLNDELANRNTELNRLNSDLNNLHLSINTAIVVLSHDLTIRRYTPQAAQVFNLREGDVGRPLRSIRHNLDFPDLEPFLAEIIDSVQHHEREVRDQEGQWYSLRARPYLTLDNQVDGAVLMLVDITALKQAEQNIVEARDFAQAVVESVPPLLILSADLRVQVANESFYQSFRVTPAQTEHCLVYELGEGQWDIPELRTLLEEILSQNTRFKHYEVTHDFETIGRRTMLLSGCRVHARQSVVISIEDITERKAAEEALRQAKEALAQHASQLEQFSHALAHDMRAPLRAMQSFASLLEEQAESWKDAQSSDWLHRIKVAAARLDELVRDSLNYSRILRQELPLQPVDAAALLRGILETYPNLQPPAVDIKLELDEVRVLGNQAGLTQVFSNLLGNAVKFVAAGVKPSVRVWAESVPSPNPTVQSQVSAAQEPTARGVEAQSAPSLVRIWVEDNGIGIPAGEQEKIFAMFYRLHRDTEYAGTGIGLTIVREAIKRMGGRIGLESEPGKGSRFWIELPKGIP